MVSGLESSVDDDEALKSGTYRYKIQAVFKDGSVSNWQSTSATLSSSSSQTPTASAYAQRTLDAQQASVGKPFTYTVPDLVFADPANTGLTVTILPQGLPEGLTVAGKTLSGSPNQAGTYTVTVQGRQPNGYLVATTFPLTVNELPTSIASVPNLTVTVGQSFSYTVPNWVFSSVAGQAPQVSILSTSLPSGVIANGTTLQGTLNSPGPHTITAQAQNAQGGTASVSWLLIGNQPPQIQTTVNPISVLTGQVLSWTIPSNTFRDVDGQLVDVRIRAMGLPQGLSARQNQLIGVPTTTGVYTLTLIATDNGAASTETTVQLQVTQAANQPPQVTMTPPQVEGLVGDSLVYTLPEGLFFDPDGRISTITLTGTLPAGVTRSGLTLRGIPTQKGTYTLTATATDDRGSSISSQIILGINGLTAPPVSIMLAGSTTICSGMTTGLLATGCNGTIAWSNGATGNTVQVSPTVTTTYSATCSVSNTIAANTVIVTVDPPFSASITGNLVVCTGQSTTLTASSASSYRWSTGATTASISTSLTGTYSLTATNANGCWATTTATVISGSQPGTASITASPSLSLCAGQTLTLTASNGSGYQWSNGATSQAISVTAAGTYTVSVSTGSSCPALASVTVISAGRVADELSSPVAGLSFRYYQQAFSNADVDAMTGQTPTAQGTVANFNLNAQANHPADNYGYEFVGYVQVTTPGEYTFYTDSDDGSKLWIGSQLLVDNNYVHASRTVSGQLCLGVGYHAIRVRFTQAYEGAVLNVSWQGPDFAKQPIPDNKLFRNNCPSPSITGNLVVCTGQSTTLTASSASSYRWSTGATTASISTSLTGTYSLTATNANGCWATTTATVISGSQPGTASITASPSLSLCAGQTLTLTASNGSGYQWSNGATSQAISVTAAGTYTVSVSTGSSCPALASVTVISAGRVADELSSPVAGLSFRYYQQAFSNADVDAMTGQTPTAQGTVANFNLNAQANHPADNYGYEFVGYVQVTTPGEYTFYTDSDDGSKLWIGSQLLVDNNYVHASRTVSGQLCLGVGYHAIRVRFTQAYEGAVLNVSWQGPDFAKQPIPDNKLFR
nr:PA14 domain-containing protein [Spirosoma liriopis]